jgi:hypothetical protein
MDMTLPGWLRLVVAISALMQLGFGLTLLIDPARIADIWPWPMPPLTSRILGASTLVSVPLAILSVSINRYSVAAIPFVMMATYRVLQLAAGAFHTERFGDNLWLSVNYFGGGALMLAVFLSGLWAGQTGRLPRSLGAGPLATRMPWSPPRTLRILLALLGLLFVVLGVAFLAGSARAAAFWIDARGITPLTAKLFASPLTGLGLGLLLVSRASDWRMAFVPATGLITIGLVAIVALVLSRADFAPATWIGWVVAGSPLALFAAGAAILASKPRMRVSASRTATA